MPVILPNGLPANERLLDENIFVMSPDRARTQDIRPLRILALNLMPTKITTETQIARLLANSPLQVELTLLQTASHRGRHVSGDHLDAFYKTFDEVEDERFDGMIITGAPVEQLDFHEVNYWEELKGIFDWSLTHAYSTLHVCWGAFAALWHHYGIRKRPLAEKLFGIFEHEVLRPSNPLVRGFDDRFFRPALPPYGPQSKGSSRSSRSESACFGPPHRSISAFHGKRAANFRDRTSRIRPLHARRGVSPGP